MLFDNCIYCIYCCSLKENKDVLPSLPILSLQRAAFYELNLNTKILRKKIPLMKVSWEWERVRACNSLRVFNNRVMKRKSEQKQKKWMRKTKERAFLQRRYIYTRVHGFSPKWRYFTTEGMVQNGKIITFIVFTKYQGITPRWMRNLQHVAVMGTWDIETRVGKIKIDRSWTLSGDDK